MAEPRAIHCHVGAFFKHIEVENLQGRAFRTVAWQAKVGVAQMGPWDACPTLQCADFEVLDQHVGVLQHAHHHATPFGLGHVYTHGALIAVGSSKVRGHGVRWNIAMRPGKRKLLDKARPVDRLTDQFERLEASIRAKVEHPFRVIKRQFGHVKVRYRSLAKNTAQLHTLFALSNLWRGRGRLMGAQA